MQADRTRVAAYALCRDADGRILLTRFIAEGNPHSGWWTMPGGGMEWGEQTHETAARETLEETGLTVDVGRVLAVLSQWMEPPESHRNDRYHSVQVVHEATNPRGVLQADFAHCDTTDAAGWFTIAEARALPQVGLVTCCLELCGRSEPA